MPRSKATSIVVTARQKAVLSHIQSQKKAEHRLVMRAQIILLAASGKSNSFIADYLHITRDTVILWLSRWTQQKEKLDRIEAQDDDKALARAVISGLSDKPRPGAPITFTAEQVCQIIAIASEAPQQSERPTTHWTARELTDEVQKRKIVPQISVRTVGRFLKSGGTEASSNSELGAPRRLRHRNL